MIKDIIYKDVSKLIPYARNARTHNDAQVTQIAASIKEFGFVNPILTDGDNGVIAGHGRLMAAKKLGMEQVPTIELSGLTKTQKQAYILADNKIALNSGWDDDVLNAELLDLVNLDFDINIIGFDDIKIDTISDYSSEEPESGSADSIEQRCNKGDIWKLGRHRLMCGDSTDINQVDRLVNGNKMQMVFTDPPYNVKISNLGSGGNGIGKFNEFAMASGEMTDNEFTDFLRSVFFNISSVSNDEAIIYICMDWRHAKNVLIAGDAFKELKNICVWNKDNGGMGSFYRSKHEFIFVYKNKDGKHINNFELGQHGRYRTNVWDYPIVSSFANKEKQEEMSMHPTVKPTQLVQDAILDCSKINGVVLDLFGGSGTTLIACENTNRDCFMMEYDERYCDTIINRYEKLTGNKAELWQDQD